MRKLFWVFCALAALLALTFIGCQTDTQRIRATNEAIAPPAATNTPVPRATSESLSAEISSIDIEEGDCINSTLPEGITFESVEIVPCTQEFQYRTLNMFSLPDSGPYPAQDEFPDQAYQHCDPRFSVYIYPSRESWLQGDKRIACLQESFGLSVSDPAKLDRLLNPFSLGLGSCFNLMAETESPLVERMHCSGEWAYRIVSAFEADDASSYPGEDALAKQAFEKCDRRTNFPYAPVARGWTLGERTVLCTQESFGLSTRDPGKLDRLVSAISLMVGECYKDAPETRNQLVELVACSGEWEYRVTNRINVAQSGPYPGEDYFEEIAADDCGEPPYSYRYPSPETWQFGHRVVLCIEQGF